MPAAAPGDKPFFPEEVGSTAGVEEAFVGAFVAVAEVWVAGSVDPPEFKVLEGWPVDTPAEEGGGGGGTSIDVAATVVSPVDGTAPANGVASQ